MPSKKRGKPKEGLFHASKMSQRTTEDVLDKLPAIKKFIDRGEITLGDYNQWWPLIVCAEIGKKIGCSLVFRCTTTQGPTGPMPIFTTWYMGISYRFIFGYQHAEVCGHTIEEQLSCIVGALYNQLAVVGALPFGLARLCARYELLRPVILCSLPWWEHLMLKLNEDEFKDLRFDIPDQITNHNMLVAKVEKLQGYMRAWAEQFWVDKLFLRVPSYINMIRLWSNGLPNTRIPDEDFQTIYDDSGFKDGKFHFVEDYLVDEMDPQKCRLSIKDRLHCTPGVPHPFVFQVPPKLIPYLDGHEKNPNDPTPVDVIDFVHGGPVCGTKTNPISIDDGVVINYTNTSDSKSSDTLVVDCSKKRDDRSKTDMDLDSPADYQVIVTNQKDGTTSTTVSSTQKKDYLSTFLIYNVPEEKDAKIAYQIEYDTVRQVLELEHLGHYPFEICGRIGGQFHSKNRPLKVRLLKGQLPDFQDFKHKLARHPTLKHLRLHYPIQEHVEEKWKELREDKQSDDKDRRRKEETRRDTRKEDTLVVGEDVKEQYARRLYTFITRLATNLGMELEVNNVGCQDGVKCQLKLSSIPFMIFGGVGTGPDARHAESIAHVGILSRLIEMELLPMCLVDAVSTHEEWVDIVVSAMLPAIEFFKSLLKNPDFSGLFSEIEMWERSGSRFVGATRRDQEDTVARFISAMAAYSSHHWSKTTITAPEGVDIPKVPDGGLKIVPNALSLFKKVVNKVSESDRERKNRSRSRSRDRKREKKRSRSRDREGRRRRSSRSRSRERRRERDRDRKRSRSRSAEKSKGEREREKERVREKQREREKEREREEKKKDHSLSSHSTMDPSDELRRLAEQEAELERKNNELQRQLQLLEEGKYDQVASAWKKSLQSVPIESGRKEELKKIVENKKSRWDGQSSTSTPIKVEQVIVPTVTISANGKSSFQTLPVSSNIPPPSVVSSSAPQQMAPHQPISFPPLPHIPPPGAFSSPAPAGGSMLSGQYVLPPGAQLIPVSGAVQSPFPYSYAAPPYQQQPVSYSNTYPPPQSTYHGISQSISSMPPPSLSIQSMSSYANTASVSQLPPIKQEITQPAFNPHTAPPPQPPQQQQSAQSQLSPQSSSTPSMGSTSGMSAEQLRQQRELIDLQLKNMELMEMLKKQTAATNSVEPSPVQRQQEPPKPIVPADISGNSFVAGNNFSTGNNFANQMFMKLRSSFPPQIPDWVLGHFDPDKLVTHNYIMKICSYAIPPSEVDKLMREPAICHTHDNDATMCTLHAHVGLHHSVIKCGLALPWSRREELADINGVCRKRICIARHSQNGNMAECGVKANACGTCGENHFAIWCKNGAKKNGLYDI